MQNNTRTMRPLEISLRTSQRPRPKGRHVGNPDRPAILHNGDVDANGSAVRWIKSFEPVAHWLVPVDSPVERRVNLLEIPWDDCPSAVPTSALTVPCEVHPV